MKQKVTNQEILLITGTSFSSRPFSRRNTDNKEGQDHSTMDDLEKACWDGMLNDLLPELAGDPSNGNRNFIWNIITGAHFLSISMGPCPIPRRNTASINPHFFLSSVLYN